MTTLNKTQLKKIVRRVLVNRKPHKINCIINIKSHYDSPLSFYSDNWSMLDHYRFEWNFMSLNKLLMSDNRDDHKQPSFRKEHFGVSIMEEISEDDLPF